MARNIEETEWEESQTQGLHLAMSQLDERSRDIINSRWLADEKATLHDLAAKYNVSAERIRQLEQNAMNKVKGAILAA
jgi:RNA polymerase sigma-32 factor